MSVDCSSPFPRVPSLAVAAGLALLLSGGAGYADVVLDATLSGVNPRTGSDLAAHVVFSSSGDTLSLELTNVGDPAQAPSDVLTGLFWNMSDPGNSSLSASSAQLSGNSAGKQPPTILHAAGNDAVGKQWGYGSFSKPVYGVDQYGIGAAGFGLFGKGSFDNPGSNVHGVDYGLVNGLSGTANGGLNVPLVSNSLTFTWTGISGIPAITDLEAQFGSNLNEPHLSAGVAPEPTLAGLLVFAGGVAMLRRRRPRG